MSDYESMGEYEYPVLDGSRRRSWSGESMNYDGYQNSPDMTPLRPIDSETPWFKEYWRPAIAWQYFAVCLFDFIIMPLVTLYFLKSTGGEFQQWQPITLVAGGFYHVAMGGIIGVTAYGRSQEKIKGVE